MLYTVFRALAVAGLITSISAHAVMNMPEPYGFGSGLTNGPMTAANFPCKKNEVQFTGGNKTTWSGGQSQPLQLLSGATHGGGSCFIAMTYETPGSAAFEDASNWKNVYTIPGDCPATTAGNLEGDMHTVGGYPTGPQCSSANSGQTDCVHSYTIAMPDELKDGDATFGWVWLSHVTTETYMNCAPITIAGSKNNGKYDALPSLKGMSFTGLSGGGVPGASSSSGSSSYGSGSGSSSASDPASESSSGSSASTASSGNSPASSPSTLPTVVVSSGSADSGTGSTSTSAGNTSSGACTSGAIKCSGSKWWMCSNEAWVSMGSVGGLTCTNGTLNKLKRFRGMR